MHVPRTETASLRTWQAGPTLQDWKKANKLEKPVASQEKPEGNYKHLTWLKGLREGIHSEEFPPPRVTKMCGARIYIEKF